MTIPYRVHDSDIAMINSTDKISTRELPIIVYTICFYSKGFQG
jgi:hypothetical protein